MPTSHSSNALRPSRAFALTLLTFTLAMPLAASAQEACKPTKLKNPAVKLDEIFRMAESHAKAWKSDVVPARISNTSMGPLKPDGSAEAWVVNFFSASSNAHISVTTFRGQLICWAQAGHAGRVPDLKPGFVLDGAKLYALAKEHGGQFIADGHDVMLGSAAAPSNRHATWILTFDKANKTAPVMVVVDANTGKLKTVQQR